MNKNGENNLFFSRGNKWKLFVGETEQYGLAEFEDDPCLENVDFSTQNLQPSCYDPTTGQCKNI